MSPNDFGKKLLVEQCQKIKVGDFIRKSNEQLKEILLKSLLEADGLNIMLNKSLTGFGGARWWFSCPICNKRAGILYKHPMSQILGCRTCLKLDYKKHRFGKMVENDI